VSEGFEFLDAFELGESPARHPDVLVAWLGHVPPRGARPGTVLRYIQPTPSLMSAAAAACISSGVSLQAWAGPSNGVLRAPLQLIKRAPN
jgi:hypothetical protein